jgi:hypothetical protein
MPIQIVDSILYPLFLYLELIPNVKSKYNIKIGTGWVTSFRLMITHNISPSGVEVGIRFAILIRLISYEASPFSSLKYVFASLLFQVSLKLYLVLH